MTIQANKELEFFIQFMIAQLPKETIALIYATMSSKLNDKQKIGYTQWSMNEMMNNLDNRHVWEAHKKLDGRFQKEQERKLKIAQGERADEIYEFLGKNVSKDGLIQIKTAIDQAYKSDDEMPDSIAFMHDMLRDEIGDQCPRCAKYEEIHKGCNVADYSWSECSNCGHTYNHD